MTWNAVFARLNSKYLEVSSVTYGRLKVSEISLISEPSWNLKYMLPIENNKNSNINFDYSMHAIYRLERAMNKMDSIEYELWGNKI